MKKHTLPAFAVALAIVISGTWGSMRCVSASDTIKVIPIGSGITTTTNSKVSSKQVNKVASVDNKITIEIIPDKTSDESASDTNGEIAGINYSDLVMANVEEAVNIRDEASEKGKIIGKFFTECAGTIIEKGNGWTKVKTGDVTGWISNDYLLFGDKAISLAKKVVARTATCTTDCLRVRKEADPNAKVLELLAEGEQIEVLDEQGEWVHVVFSDGDEGYVSAEYVRIADELGTGKSMEVIKAQEEAEKKEQEALAASVAKAEKDAKSNVTTQASSQPAAVVAVNTPGVAAGYSDVVLLAALIQAEAGGQPYEGQVSVGTVVMNRLRSGRYGGSIYSVIYAKSQFGPAGSGQVAQIAAVGPKATCLQAAQDAINGVNYIGTATHFRNIRSGYQGIVIGSHVFW